VPRRTRPKKQRGRAAASPEKAEPLRAPDIVTGAPEGWQVRVVQPASATKEYRCPDCNQVIRPGTKHVVAWREHDQQGRRHWHVPCWERSVRRK
jgi:hypothetical protein